MSAATRRATSCSSGSRFQSDTSGQSCRCTEAPPVSPRQITSVVSEAPGPGGTTITTQQDVARSSSDLIPILGMVQVNAGDMGVIPYLGAGAGYEILHLSSDDFQNGQQFRGTFGGFGWQIWTGVAVPLSSQAKLTAEAFLNRADVSRDSTDPTTGDNIRETVNMDGVGARFGLQWGF